MNDYHGAFSKLLAFARGVFGWAALSCKEAFSKDNTVPGIYEHVPGILQPAVVDFAVLLVRT